MTLELRDNVSVIVILVGVDEYDTPEDAACKSAFTALPHVATDLRRLRDLFESPHYLAAGFQVIDPIRGVDAPDIQRQLNRLRKHFAPAGRDLSALVFWSGHAATVQNELRLVTRDCSEPLSASDGYSPAALVGQVVDFGPLRGICLVFDVCQAAAGATDVFGAVAQRSIERPASAPLAMEALFSAHAFEPARDGTFVECLASLLEAGPSDGARRRMDEEERWPINPRSPKLTLSDVADAVHFELEAMPPERLRSTTWPISAGRPRALFPNPDYRPHMPAVLVEHARAFVGTGDVESHFMPKARGLEPGEAGWFFSGRNALSAALVGWLDRTGAADRSPLVVLTGGGGSGKSALIGRLVALSDSNARTLARAQGWDEAADTWAGTVPRLGAIDAALHLRGLSTEQVMQALGELLQMPEASTAVDPSSFVTAVPLTRGTDAHPTTLVLDALDESTDPARLAEAVVAALARRGVRLLVATRRRANAGESVDLLERLGAAQVHDLDRLDSDADVRDYVTARLEASTGLQTLPPILLGLVDWIVEQARGKFLFARMAASALQRAAPQQTMDVAALERLVGHGVGDALRRELRVMDEAFTTRFGAGEAGASLLFTALAWAMGAGVPLRDDLWPRSAAAIGRRAVPFTAEQARWLLREGGRYIVEAGDGEQAVYRLYHQGLVDELRGEPRAGPAIAEVLERHAAESGGWAEANVYAVRHVVALAVARRSTDGGAASGPVDAARCERIACDFDWLATKLRLDGAYELLNDLSLATASLDPLDEQGAAVRQVERVLLQSAAVLARDPRQLATQLVGRLTAAGSDAQHDTIRKLAADARDGAQGPWLRPLTPSLAGERSRRWMRPAAAESLTNLAFSRNGRWAVHVSRGSDVHLWDLRSWQQQGVLFQAHEPPYRLAVSDDGRFVGYAGLDGALSRWSAATGIVTMEQRSDSLPSTLEISADGRYTLAGRVGTDELAACDFETLLCVSLHDAIAADLAGYSLAANGRDALVIDERGDALLLDLWPVRERIRFKWPEPPNWLARSSDGRRVVGFGQGAAGELRDLDRPEVVVARLRAASGRTSTIALSASGLDVAVGTDTGGLHVWHDIHAAPTAAPGATPAPPPAVAIANAQTYTIGALAFADARLLSGDYIQIKEWEIDGTPRSAPVAPPAETVAAEAGLAISSDGLSAVGVTPRGAVLWRLDGTRDRIEMPVRLPLPIDMAWGSDAVAVSATTPPRLLAWTREDEMRVFDFAASRVATHHAASKLLAATLSPDGTLVAYLQRTALVVWHVERQQVERIERDARAGALAFSPDGRRIAVGFDSRLVVFDVVDGLQAHVQGTLDKGACRRIAYAGDRVVIAGDDGGLHLLPAAATGLSTPIQFSGRHPDRPFTLLVAADGRHALTTSPFGGTSVWDIEACALLRHLPVGGIAFRMSHPFGRALLSTPDGVLKVFSLETGATLASFQADRQVINGVADAELRQVVVCDQGGQVHFLRLED